MPDTTQADAIAAAERKISDSGEALRIAQHNHEQALQSLVTTRQAKTASPSAVPVTVVPPAKK